MEGPRKHAMARADIGTRTAGCGRRGGRVSCRAINGESARHYQCQGGTISATPFLGPLPPYLASTKSDR